MCYREYEKIKIIKAMTKKLKMQRKMQMRSSKRLFNGGDANKNAKTCKKHAKKSKPEDSDKELTYRIENEKTRGACRVRCSDGTSWAAKYDDDGGEKKTKAYCLGWINKMKAK